jgi:hypothetical protein
MFFFLHVILVNYLHGSIQPEAELSILGTSHKAAMLSNIRLFIRILVLFLWETKKQVAVVVPKLLQGSLFAQTVFLERRVYSLAPAMSTANSARHICVKNTFCSSGYVVSKTNCMLRMIGRLITVLPKLDVVYGTNFSSFCFYVRV